MVQVWLSHDPYCTVILVSSTRPPDATFILMQFPGNRQNKGSRLLDWAEVFEAGAANGEPLLQDPLFWRPPNASGACDCDCLFEVDKTLNLQGTCHKELKGRRKRPITSCGQAALLAFCSQEPYPSTAPSYPRTHGEPPSLGATSVCLFLSSECLFGTSPKLPIHVTCFR